MNLVKRLCTVLLIVVPALIATPSAGAIAAPVPDELLASCTRNPTYPANYPPSSVAPAHAFGSDTNGCVAQTDLDATANYPPSSVVSAHQIDNDLDVTANYPPSSVVSAHQIDTNLDVTANYPPSSVVSAHQIDAENTPPMHSPLACITIRGPLTFLSTVHRCPSTSHRSESVASQPQRLASMCNRDQLAMGAGIDESTNGLLTLAFIVTGADTGGHGRTC